jgi:hypothetical protein|tara:strand:+ start:12533 stop:13219 length:687 start_codon:yes stop_codon:yes gene_type:complete
MKINLQKTKFYYLTCNNKIRKTHLLQEFKDYNLTEINPFLNLSKKQSGATGYCRMLEMGIINQDKDKPFQPFILLEDDVKKYRKFPNELEIPEECDILYIGLSYWGIKKNFFEGEKGIVCYKNITEDIIKIYNMLSTHGMIICSMTGALVLQKCLMEDCFRNRGYDISLAQIQPYYNIYALKTPLIYQFKKIGGKEKSTKLEYNTEDKDIHPKWINKNNLSIIISTKF